MKKSELCVIVFMLLFSGFFFYNTMDLPPEAQTYPRFIIGLLVALTILKLVLMILASKKSKEKIINDDADVWEGLLPKQFAVVCVASLLYFVLMYFFGFYVASLAYLVYCLHFFHISLKYSIITILTMLVLIYAVFTIFLNVPLPTGEILSQFI